MALVYLLGIVSGVLLVAMILATWIHNAAQRINEQHTAYSGEPPVARHAKNRDRRRDRLVAASP